MKQYKYESTFTFNGKRYRVRANSKSDLAVKVAIKKRDLEENRVIIEPNMTVATWAQEWLNTYKKPHLSITTFKDYTSRVNRLILPIIGNMKLKDVKLAHCQRIINELEGYSQDRINKVYNTLTQMFEIARLNHLILEKPTDGLKRITGESGSHRSISKYERIITLKVAESHYAGLWVKTMLYTGLRPQETAALQGRHIDAKNMLIHVEQALKSDGTIGITKTKSGSRSVPLPEILLPLAKTKPFDFVFTSSEGNPLNKTRMRRWWNSFKREMQIEAGCKLYRNKLIAPYPIADDLVPYCYRHTFCTDLQDAGIPINIAKELMGHSDISVTANIYTHLSEMKLKDVANMLSDYRQNVTPCVTPLMIKR